MRPDALGRHALRDGAIQRVGARVKLLVAAAYVVGVVATPVGAWKILAGEAVVLGVVVGVARVPILPLLGRWLGLLATVGLLAAVLAQGHPERGRLGFWPLAAAILARNAMALGAILTLSAVTPFPKLLGALRGLGVPGPLVATIHFLYRYLHVLAEELDRMSKARRSRNFRRSGRLDWGLLTGLIGVLFLRSFERGERVHAAMLARGFDGTLRTLEEG